MEDKIQSHIIIEEAGRHRVLLTYALFRKAAAIYLVWVVLSCIEYIYHYTPYFQKVYHLWINIYIYRIIPLMHFVHIILGVASYYLQNKAYNLQKTALRTGDSEGFISSYKVFRRGMILGILITATAILSILIFFITHNPVT